jgi:hypothetical protein
LFSGFFNLAFELSDFLRRQPMAFVIVLALLTVFFLWACLWIVLRNLLAMRKLLHAERLKMIEAGQSKELLQAIENQSQSHRFFSIAFSLASFVPMVALLGATFATVRYGESFATPLVAWCGAVVVSLASTICATIVMSCRRSGDARG